MRAPVTHDPLVVNTQDGSCWRRRAVTREGRGLYGLEGTAKDAPELVLSSLSDLAELGLASMADVLPMPMGPKPQADPIVVGRQLDLLALMDERAASKVSPVLAAVLNEAERLRARVSELETRPAAEDVVTWLRSWSDVYYATPGRSESGAAVAALADRLARGEGRPPAVSQPDRLTRTLAPTQALREDAAAETGGA